MKGTGGPFDGGAWRWRRLEGRPCAAAPALFVFSAEVKRDGCNERPISGA